RLPQAFCLLQALGGGPDARSRDGEVLTRLVRDGLGERPAVRAQQVLPDGLRPLDDRLHVAGYPAPSMASVRPPAWAAETALLRCSGIRVFRCSGSGPAGFPSRTPEHPNT